MRFYYSQAVLEELTQRYPSRPEKQQIQTEMALNAPTIEKENPNKALRFTGTTLLLCAYAATYLDYSRME